MKRLAKSRATVASNPSSRSARSQASSAYGVALHRNEFNPDEIAEDVDDEREADVFAAYLLMPEPWFDKEWQEVRGLSLFDAVMKIKRIFRVSYRTVLYRLDERGIKDVWRRFMAQAEVRLGRPLTRTDEPDPLAPTARGSAAPEPLRGREPFELARATSIRTAGGGLSGGHSTTAAFRSAGRPKSSVSTSGRCGT